MLDTRFTDAQNTIGHLTKGLAEFVVGQDPVRLALEIAACSGLSVLVMGHSGTGKTHSTKSTAKLCGATYARVQVTPDTMPSDIIDFLVFNQETGRMERRRGVIRRGMFVHIDELNRGNEKVQNALNEPLDERQVTLDGETLSLEEPSIIVATQNPDDYLGTEETTEAVRDRFGLSVTSCYPTPAEEVAIMKLKRSGSSPEAKLDPDTLKEIRCLNDEVAAGIEAKLLQYIANQLAKLRTDAFSMKVSVRAAMDIMKAAAHMALRRGSSSVEHADIDAIFVMCVEHRVEFKEHVADKTAQLKRTLGIQ